MTAPSQGNSPLQWKLFIRRRASATQGTPPGKDELKWVANTVTLIYGEHDALLVDTFLSEAQTAELAHWIASPGKRLSTIYITHAHADHFFGLKLLRDRFPEARAIALPQVADAMRAALAPEAVETPTRSAALVTGRSRNSPPTSRRAMPRRAASPPARWARLWSSACRG